MDPSRYHMARVLIDISEDTAISTATGILGWRVVAVALPAVLTGTALTFQIDPGDGTFRAVEDYDGAALTLTVEASKVVQIGDDTQPAPWIVGARVKVVSGSTEGDDREIFLLCVPL